MNSFIKACEVWIPSDDRSMLSLSAGLFGKADALGAEAGAMRLRRGEDLPGRAWEQGRPVIVTDLGEAAFRRSAAAAAAGIHCAVAMPVFVLGQMSSLLVFYCGDASNEAGAIELWHNDPRISTDMKLVDGYYGAGCEALEALSRDAYLPRGTGLAGVAWQRGAAVLITDLGHSTNFLRGNTTDPIGINRGLAVPCSSRGDHHYTLSFLSASKAPIAQTIESWAAKPDQSGLQRILGYSESTGALPLGRQAPTLALGSGAIASAFESGIAQVEAAASADASSLLAFPVIADGRVGEVVALHF